MSSIGRIPAEEIDLRQAAFSVEQMAPQGIERKTAGQISAEDLNRAIHRLADLVARPKPPDTDKPTQSLDTVLARAETLKDRMVTAHVDTLVYIGDREFDLKPRLRSAAIEVDFCFGDRDGNVSQGDIKAARQHYGLVRGPVGWNRLLLTDELERKLYPERTLKTTKGLKLLPRDWRSDDRDPLARLREIAGYIDDGALARTYADIAARYATVATDETEPPQTLLEQALTLLGIEIKQRNSARPTITDIARIGCEDPEIKACLKSPIEMSRRLQQRRLIDQFL